MSVSLVVVFSAKHNRLLVFNDAQRRGPLDIYGVVNASNENQVLSSFCSHFDIKLQETATSLVHLAECTAPDWGHASLPPLLHRFYLLEPVDQVYAVLQTPRTKVHYEWLDPIEALAKWNASELLLAPSTLYILQSLTNQSHGKPFSRASSQQNHLRCMYSPLLEIIPLPSHTIPPFSRTNTVFMRSQNDCLIVDPGAAPSHHEQLEQAIRERANGTNITVVITHHHRDHLHGLPCIERLAPQAVVLAHPKTLPRLNTSLQRRAASNDEVLRIGDSHVKIFFTPGHTDGHLVVFEPKARILLAGDHVVGIGSAVLDPECGDMREYLDSTRLLINLQPRVLYPAHGPPCFDAVALLQTYIEHRERREAEILASYARGNKTAEAITHDVYTDVAPAMHAFALRNVELHLRKLRQESRL